MDSFKIFIDDVARDVKVEDALKLDVVSEENHSFHILHHSMAFNVVIEEADDHLKNMTYRINGTKYSVSLKDKYDLLVDNMGYAKTDVKKINEIYAPMPGLLLDVLVTPGQSVVKGDSLLILEAMKMENVLKSEGTGIVKNIVVEKGAAVEKGQLIIEME